ncbi:MAG TPA: LEA type 2 family protein [Anaeromyxobacteraceae bacterium]|nr:LEA type 2 family protein [Anaeromyxobacteraceae bacterium]
MRKLALALAFVAAAGCSHKRPRPPPPAPIPVAPPAIAFEGAKIDELKFTQMLMTFRARVDNPNPFPLSVSRVRFGILLEGRPAAQGQIDAAFAVPAAAPEPSPVAADPAAPPAAPPALVPGRGSLTFPVAIRFGAIPGFVKVMATQKEAAYALTGAVAFNTPYGIVEVPIQGGGVVPVPKKPDVQVARLQLRSASPTAIVLELRVKIGNTNVFPLPSASLAYTLFVSGKDVAHATGRLESPLGVGETAELVVPIEISPFKAGKAAARFLLPFASIKVALKGGIDFDGVPIPLDLDADVLPKS